MIIDAHQHFWRFEPAEYTWIDDEMQPLRRDYLPDDLQAEISAAGIDAVITVQARQSLDETAWLLELAKRHPFIRAIVGWVPLAAPDVEGLLERFTQDAHLKAVRHVVQDEPDEHFLSGRYFNAGLAALRRFNLAYDILIYERQLPQAIEFVDRHQNQQFVLNHLAKPEIPNGSFQPWATRIHELARRENVVCKVSGLTTQAARYDWTGEQLKPYLDTVLEAFSPRRLMFGSDWPVCLLATSYARWHQVILRWAESLTAVERSWLFGKTAIEVYRILATDY